MQPDILDLPPDGAGLPLEALGLGWIDADLSTGRTDVNQAAAASFGGDERWLMNGVGFDCLMKGVHANDRECVSESIRAMRADSPSFVAEIRTRPAGGKTCWLMVRGRGYFDAEGLLVRLIGVLVDITALKSDNQPYMSPPPGAALERLDQLADLVITARRLIDRLGYSEMRPSLDDLMMLVGMRLGAQLRLETLSKMH